jgi:hypothetical protein
MLLHAVIALLMLAGMAGRAAPDAPAAGAATVVQSTAHPAQILLRAARIFDAHQLYATTALRAVLSCLPARVQLWFNKRLEAQFSYLSVWDAEGRQVDSGDIRVGPDTPR